LMNPNHYLAVAIHYLLSHRPQWSKAAAVGKTLVSSGLIDRVVAKLDRKLFEVPVGFKWFSAGLFDGSLCFGGEESAGASFLCQDGTVWTTDKDGIILCLLAAEISANELAGEPITAKLTRAPGNGAALGGLKVTAKSGWFAVRPSGTEDLCKIYAESLLSADHLKSIETEARQIMQAVFTAAGA